MLILLTYLPAMPLDETVEVGCWICQGRRVLCGYFRKRWGPRQWQAEDAARRGGGPGGGGGHEEGRPSPPPPPRTPPPEHSGLLPPPAIQEDGSWLLHSFEHVAAPGRQVDGGEHVAAPGRQAHGSCLLRRP